MRILAALAVPVLFLAACGDADSEPEAPPAATDEAQDDEAPDDEAPDDEAPDDEAPDDELQDAGEVLEDRAVEGADAQHLEFGDTAQDDDVTVTVRSAEWGDGFDSGDTDYRDLILDVRFENTGDEDAEGPLITAHCRGQDMYSNQHEGPIGVFDPLPGGTAADGEAIISVEQPCEDGWLAWNPGFDVEDEWRWPMPAEG
jgi:hypothetical protein